MALEMMNPSSVVYEYRFVTETRDRGVILHPDPLVWLLI